MVWTPGLTGAAALSQRDGDFLLDVGQAMAIGYSHHDADTVTLYLEESFSFPVTERDAALALSSEDARAVNGGAPAGGTGDMTAAASDRRRDKM